MKAVIVTENKDLVIREIPDPVCGEKEVLIDDIRSLNFDFTTRAGLVWNNSKYYIGTSFINYIYGYNRGYFNLRNSISYLNFYVGFNFHQRK